MATRFPEKSYPSDKLKKKNGVLLFLLVLIRASFAIGHLYSFLANCQFISLPGFLKIELLNFFLN